MTSGRSGTRCTALLLLLAAMLAALGVGGSSLVRMPEVAAPGDTLRPVHHVAAATVRAAAEAPTGPGVRGRPRPTPPPAGPPATAVPTRSTTGHPTAPTP